MNMAVKSIHILQQNAVICSMMKLKHNVFTTIKTYMYLELLKSCLCITNVTLFLSV